MPKYELHAAVADKIYSILGSGVIKNAPLFFAGNLAPDAYSPDSNNHELIKKRTHMCVDEAAHTYGYGYPEDAERFERGVNDFIKNYVLTASEDRDLYIGYVVHLLTDKIHRLTVYNRLEGYLRNSETISNEPDFRKKITDKVISGEYALIFKEISGSFNIPIHEYPFNQNLEDILNSVCDCEIKDYITAKELNAFIHSVLNSIRCERKQSKPTGRYDGAIWFVDYSAREIITLLDDNIYSHPSTCKL